MISKRIKRSFRIGKYVAYKETSLNAREQLWSFLGAFAGIGSITFIHHVYLNEQDTIYLLGSFGASAVLVYGAIHSPLAQPRNLVGGHIISALIGVSVARVLPDTIWLSAPLAVALSIIAMQYAKTLHPPGGATALIAVTGSAKIKSLGYFYVLFPVLSGVLVLLLMALVFNNITPDRRYPATGRFLKGIKWVVKNIKSNNQ